MQNTATVVRAFFDAVPTEGVGCITRFASDDLKWWSAGLGEVPVAALSSMSQTMGSHFATPMRLTVHDLIVEGDKAAAEVEAYVELNDGVVYHNHYHFKFVVTDGKVRSVKEYQDTAHAASVWGGKLG